MFHPMFTQLLHRWDGQRLRRYLLLRPFGPTLELEELGRVPELPEYDAEADLAPRTPQMLEYELQPSDLELPRCTPPLSVGCDRSGSCCSQYPVIATTLAERETALVTLRRNEDAWSLPFDPEEAFAPAYPGHATPLSPILVGDGCSFLGKDGCRLHAIGGPAAKPATCRQFPLQVIHDGSHLELSILPHCACAARCVGPGSEDDWPHDLVASYRTIPQIPERILVDDQRMLPRGAYLQWVRALSDVLASAPQESPLALLEKAAQSLQLPPARLTAAWLDRLEERALDEAERFEAYLDAESPQPKGLRWVAELAALTGEQLSEQPHTSRSLSLALQPLDAPVLALALRAHVLLELPTLHAALLDITRLVALAGWARRLGHTSALDPRFEPLPLLFYLWASTRWPVSSEPSSPR